MSVFAVFILTGNYILSLLYFITTSVFRCEPQCCHLICSNLSVNHLCIVGTNFKFSCLFSCDIRKIYCDLLSKLTKLGTSFAIMLNSSFLFLYVLHCVRKWISFSTVDGQNGQNRSSLGSTGRLCLPFSIMRQWSDSLYFLNVAL